MLTAYTYVQQETMIICRYAHSIYICSAKNCGEHIPMFSKKLWSFADMFTSFPENGIVEQKLGPFAENMFTAFPENGIVQQKLWAHLFPKMESLNKNCDHLQKMELFISCLLWIHHGEFIVKTNEVTRLHTVGTLLRKSNSSRAKLINNVIIADCGFTLANRGTLSNFPRKPNIVKQINTRTFPENRTL